MKKMDKLIKIQIRDEETETWADWKSLLASINASGTANRFGSSESYKDGGERTGQTLTFEVRYLPALEALRDGGLYRIIYRNRVYNLVGYDDYFERHQTIRLAGELYGEKYSS